MNGLLVEVEDVRPFAKQAVLNEVRVVRHDAGFQHPQKRAMVLPQVGVEIVSGTHVLMQVPKRFFLLFGRRVAGLDGLHAGGHGPQFRKDRFRQDIGARQLELKGPSNAGRIHVVLAVRPVQVTVEDEAYKSTCSHDGSPFFRG